MHLLTRIGTFVRLCLQGSMEKLSDEAIEETLDKVVKLLAYISDKDLFAGMNALFLVYQIR